MLTILFLFSVFCACLCWAACKVGSESDERLGDERAGKHV
jgi:hypothetical protein